MRLYLIVLSFLFIGYSALSQSSDQDSLLILIEQESNPNLRANYLLQISKSVYEQSHDAYLSYSQKALSETEDPQFDNDTLKMKIINNVGCAYSEINDAKLANQYFFEAVELAKKNNDLHYLSNLYNNIGLTYGNVQQYDKAIENHFQSLKIKEERNDSLGISISYTNIGAVYYHLKDYDKAKTAFQKSFEISQSISDTEGIAFGYTNLADILFAEGEFDKALKNYYLYLDMVTEMNYNHSILYGHKKIGEIHVKLNNPAKAAPHVEKAYEMATEFNYTWELTNICLLYADLKKQTDDIYAALIFAKKALKYFPESASKKKLASIHQSISDLYEMQGNVPMAYHHLKIYQVERDSALQKENMETFADMEAKYQLEVKENENFYLKQEQTLSGKIISQRTILAVVSMFGILFLVIMLYRLYRKKETQQKINVVLEQKVLERTSHLQILNDKLEQANIELERFFYITSHDLKEPLRTIMCFSSLAKRSIKEKKYEAANEYLSFTERGTTQLETLIKGIMEFFSIGREDSHKLYPIDVILNEGKEGIRDLLKEKNPQITFKSDEELDNILLPEQIAIVFKNLIDNGVRFNENKIPTIDITFKENSERYHFIFKDNGIGIPKEYHKQIFEMFKRLSSHDKHLGSGIGLSICQKIVQQFDGDIMVKDTGADGSTIEFWISKAPCKIYATRIDALT